MATISKWYLYFDGKQGSDYLPEYLFSHLLILPSSNYFVMNGSDVNNEEYGI